jgi:serine/threonine protein phosphatase PrpC
VLTNIPVRLEYEWRTCFPHERKIGISFVICTIINEALWTLSAGDCKAILIGDGKIFLLNEETSPSTHALGTGNIAGISPRAKVTRFPLNPDKSPTLFMGTAFLFEKYSPREIAEKITDVKSLEALKQELEASKHCKKAGSFCTPIIRNGNRYDFGIYLKRE